MLNAEQWDALFERLCADSGEEWIRERRRRRWQEIRDRGLPSTRDEEWKYTSLKPLAERAYIPAEETPAVDLRLLEDYHGADIHLVFVNGVLQTDLSQTSALGVTFVSLQEALRDGSLTLRELGADFQDREAGPFAALNDALMHQGVVARVEAGARVAPLIRVLHVATKTRSPFLSVPRVILMLQERAEAQVLESHLTIDNTASYLAVPLTDIFLSRGARLCYARNQRQSVEAFHVGVTRVWQEADSFLDGFSLMSGGRIARDNIELILTAPGAEAIVNGLYTVRDHQHVDNHTSIDHRAPACQSHQLYKGILNGSARAVFNGKVLVRPEAQQTNSYQLNKNLLLGQDCRVDTKPQLEIFADDVKCSHGATIGRLNPDELFYLRTRCIGENQAVRMLAHGFVEDILSRITSEKIRNKLSCQIPH